jgi:protein-L-isoaspartate(D-aspartate) O-methyltransferase
MTDAGELVAELREAITDERVLAALVAVPRERFVLPSDLARAWDNVALPIAWGQTISQPLVVARMLELLALAPTDRVLDVGTGSGYHAALLARLTAVVFTIERLPALSWGAAQTLADLGIENVTCAVGDGARGLPEHAPFDAINVAAASPHRVPPELERQLAVGGRLIVPVGERRQFLVRSVRSETGWHRTRLDPVRFVPLLAD